MLELKDIKKYYTVGENTTKALDGVSISFRRQEFVAILGPSGSGKTTMLNVIGGLDNYDSGDMIIDGSSTKKFKDADWDAYRNNSIGFIFQSYNLISHLGIIDNVELGMTLSGVNKEEKRQKAEEALRRVGLADHMNKKPNQLSGGQMQRVAIARALANDPDILLCDEPTGALDTETSVQIMALIKELSKEKLVIMVTHNPELAKDYADRIVEFSDGQIQKDSHPHIEGKKESQFKLKHTRMKFQTALKLSFNNIRTKKGRTFLTVFASSIGIIGIAVVLSLSSGFQVQIDDTQSETLSKFPITISQSTTDQTAMREQAQKESEKEPFTNNKTITVVDNSPESSLHINKLDDEFLEYVNDINPELSNNIGYTRMVGMNLLREVDRDIQTVKFSSETDSTQSMATAMSAMTGVGVSVFPKQLEEREGENFLKDNYTLLAGDYPKKKTDVVLVVDKNNEVSLQALLNLGFKLDDDENIPFDEVVGTTFKLVANDNYYMELPTGNFIPNPEIQDVYDNPDNLDITIVGVLRTKSKNKMDLLASGIAYSDELVQEIIDTNQESGIVQAQKDSDVNIMTTEPLDATSKKTMLTYLGGDTTPYSILIYPNNFKDKDEVLAYLDAYNEGKEDDDRIIYSDLAGTMTELTGGLMDAITYVLIAFAAISLVTSMIMISIITYTSVIERTKEIGVLKALGARKRDITRVFDAETCILGISSGILGVLIAELLTFPINSVLYNMTDLENVAQLNPIHAIILVVVSTILTMLGGHIPAKMAAKKDAAIALRAE